MNIIFVVVVAVGALGFGLARYSAKLKRRRRRRTTAKERNKQALRNDWLARFRFSRGRKRLTYNPGEKER